MVSFDAQEPSPSTQVHPNRSKSSLTRTTIRSLSSPESLDLHFMILEQRQRSADNMLAWSKIQEKANKMKMDKESLARGASDAKEILEFKAEIKGGNKLPEDDAGIKHGKEIPESHTTKDGRKVVREPKEPRCPFVKLVGQKACDFIMFCVDIAGLLSVPLFFLAIALGSPYLAIFAVVVAANCL